jgi:protein-L-isoaspartate O-methyltransferase
MSWRKPVFLNEIKMAKVTSKDKVLLIGGGILPSESMTINETTNAEVVTIDNNKRACIHAEAFIKKRGLSDKIIIKYADGVNFPVKEFDVVFIAISVWPIDTVFKHLSRNLKKNARIMCKSYKEDIPALLRNEGIIDSFKLVSKIDNPSTKSYLFIKI